MTNSAANQLPDVDSLPAGFIDGSTEPLPPSTPSREPHIDYEENSLLESDCLTDSSNEVMVKSICLNRRKGREASEILADHQLQECPYSEKETDKLEFKAT